MIKIGSFSKLSLVPVKTLRYYDEIGLLKPVEVDRFTAYRYYSVDQLPRLNRILALKDLGFSLEHIASNDIASLSHETSDISGIQHIMDVDQTEVEEILGS